jgi:flagellar biosynthesis/type III secretory pathway protein FliH
LIRLFKKSERQIELDKKVKEAEWQGYSKARIARAKAEGMRKGKTTGAERFLSTMQRVDKMMGAADSYGSNLFGLGTTPRKKATHKKHKGKRIVVYVR